MVRITSTETRPASSGTGRTRRTEAAKAQINFVEAASVYGERGDVNSCGDWLAVALKDTFRTEDGSFELIAFKAWLKETGVTPPNVDIDCNGAIGRFRMCAGLMLRRHA